MVEAHWSPRRFWTREVRRYPLAIGIGIVWGLAFPLPGWAGLAWAIPGALFLLMPGLSGTAAFRVGCVAGLAHFLVSLRWLLHMPHWAGSVAGWLVLSGYCALYPGLWLGMAQRVSGDARSQSGGAANSGWSTALGRFSQQSWLERSLLWLRLAAAWVALEMVRARFLSGFAWNFLGVSQWRQLPLLQLASVTGVYGLSFLICWFSLALTGALLLMMQRPQQRWSWTSEIRIPLLVVLLVAGWGFWSLVEQQRSVDPQSRRLRLGLVQPSVPQTLQWDAAADAASFQRIRSLSAQALALKPHVLVWPEGAYGLTDANWAEMTNLTTTNGVSWIFNTTTENAERRPMNSALWLNASGQTQGQYDKRRLVAFGEYVPLDRWLPFLRYLTPIGASFAPGAEPVTFSLPESSNAPAGVLAPIICFEDTFPHGVREHVRPGVDFLLELTNDGWFGDSSAQWQHAANAAFRAVENHIPLVRVANNGVTLWFDAVGIPHDLFGATGSVYQPGFELVEIPLSKDTGDTYYRRHGDVFGWTCVVWAVWTVLRSFRRTEGLRDVAPLCEGNGVKH